MPLTKPSTITLERKKQEKREREREREEKLNKTKHNPGFVHFAVVTVVIAITTDVVVCF